MSKRNVLALCLISLLLAGLVGCFRGDPPADPQGQEDTLEAQAVASNDIRVWHKNNEARVTWTGVGGTNGDEKLKPANELEEVSFPVLTINAVGGVLQVGGGEGYGVKSSLDGGGNNRKAINGPELLYLTLPSGAEAAFVGASLTFRIAKDTTQEVILSAKRAGEVVDSQTLNVSGPAGKSTSNRINVTLAAPADQLSFSVPAGSKVGLRDSTFTTQASSPSNPGPVSGDGRGELRLNHKSNEASLNWTLVNNQSGSEKLNPINGQAKASFPVLEIEAGNGTLEVGGGEGYGVKGSGDNNTRKKTIEGDESLTLKLTAADTVITGGSIGLRLPAGDGTQSVIVTGYLDSQEVQSETITVDGLTSTGSQTVPYPLTQDVDTLILTAGEGDSFGLRGSTFYTQTGEADGGPNDPGPGDAFLLGSYTAQVSSDFGSTTFTKADGNSPVSAVNSYEASGNSLQTQLALSNSGSESYEGLRLTVSNLPDGVSFVGPDGTTPQGDPYIDAGSLASGETSTAFLLFDIPSNQAFSYTLTIAEAEDAFGITSVSPNSFTNDAEQLITVSGHALTADTVFFAGGQQLERIEAGSATQAKLRVPRGYAPGSYSLEAFKLGAATTELVNAFTVSEGQAPLEIDPLENYEAFFGGVVIDAATLEPIAAAEVQVEGLAGITGASGMFYLQGAPVGEFTLSVSAPGYDRVQRTVTITETEGAVFTETVFLTPNTVSAQSLSIISIQNNSGSCDPETRSGCYGPYGPPPGFAFSTGALNDYDPNDTSPARRKRGGRWTNVQACVTFQDGTPASYISTNFGMTSRDGILNGWTYLPPSKRTDGSVTLQLEIAPWEDIDVTPKRLTFNPEQDGAAVFQSCFIIPGSGVPDWDGLQAIDKTAPSCTAIDTQSITTQYGYGDDDDDYCRGPGCDIGELLIRDQTLGFQDVVRSWGRNLRWRSPRPFVEADGNRLPYRLTYPNRNFSPTELEYESAIIRSTPGSMSEVPAGDGVYVEIGVRDAQGYTMGDSEGRTFNVVEALHVPNIVTVALPNDAIPSSTRTPYTEEIYANSYDELPTGLLKVYRERDLRSDGTVDVTVPVTPVDEYGDPVILLTELNFAVANADSGAVPIDFEDNDYRTSAQIPLTINVRDGEAVDISKVIAVGGDPFGSGSSAQLSTQSVEVGDCIEAEDSEGDAPRLVSVGRDAYSRALEFYEDIPLYITLPVGLWPFVLDGIDGIFYGPGCIDQQTSRYCVPFGLAGAGAALEWVGIGTVATAANQFVKVSLRLSRQGIGGAISDAVYRIMIKYDVFSKPPSRSEATQMLSEIQDLMGNLLKIIDNSNSVNIVGVLENADVLATNISRFSDKTSLDALEAVNTAIEKVGLSGSVSVSNFLKTSRNTSNLPGFDDVFDRVVRDGTSNGSNARGAYNELLRAENILNQGATNVEFLGRQVHSTGGFDVDVKSVIDGTTYFDQVKASTGFQSQAQLDKALSDAGSLMKGASEYDATARWVIGDTSDIDQQFIDRLKNICRDGICLQVIDLNGNPL